MAKARDGERDGRKKKPRRDWWIVAGAKDLRRKEELENEKRKGKLREFLQRGIEKPKQEIRHEG